MTTITPEEEFTIDWDWYAYDLQGCIGHFTSAGQRTLPRSVRQNREGVEALIHFFETSSPVTTGYVVRDGVKNDSGGWKDEARKDWYLRSFIAAAARGLYSYDTEMVGSRYYLVAMPETPLHFDQLPYEIQRVIPLAPSPWLFNQIIYIPEAATLDW